MSACVQNERMTGVMRLGRGDEGLPSDPCCQTRISHAWGSMWGAWPAVVGRGMVSVEGHIVICAVGKKGVCTEL